MTVKLRFKRPQGDTSQLISSTVRDSKRDAAAASDDFRFASAVAGFGMLLRKSPHGGDASVAMVRGLASGALGADSNGHRQGFVTLLGAFERASGQGVLTTR